MESAFLLFVSGFITGLLLIWTIYGGRSNSEILPAIGDEWPEYGGIYAGTMQGKNDKPAYHLIVLPDEITDNWDSASAWAKSLNADLPTRDEQRFLYLNLKNKFKKDWHWSGEQYAALPAFAWIQDFSNGIQYGNLKSNKYLAFAVRRILIIR